MRPSFTLGLLWRLLLFAAVTALAIAAATTPGLVAARIVAAIGMAGVALLLWRHVTRTNRELARFVEAVTLGDLQAHFDRRDGATGFGRLAIAFDAALARLRAERTGAAEELRYLQTLLDDVPVALLVVTPEGRVDLGNKAARRLFLRHHGTRAEDYVPYGAGFARRLEPDAPDGTEVLLLNLGRATRAVVRVATLTRLGRRTRAVTVEPVQGALDSVEMAAQTDLVRVLTHEILNSLTPVRSLAQTAAELLGEVDDPHVAPSLVEARIAVATLARRAEGLGRFVESYRAVSRELVPVRRRFLAPPFANELARLFAADWPAATLSLDVAAVEIDADPDLLAQALINLLRNAGEATRAAARPMVTLHIDRLATSETEITVADNGSGVPAELRREVFLPFFTTRAAGTGVGLNLVRQIAVAHGGSVEVTDGPAGGALFRMIV